MTRASCPIDGREAPRFTSVFVKHVRQIGWSRGKCGIRTVERWFGLLQLRPGRVVRVALTPLDAAHLLASNVPQGADEHRRPRRPQSTER